MDPQGWLEFLQRLADEADEIAMRFFRTQDLQVREKPDLGPVSEADLAIEEAARRHAARHDPALGVWGEEFGDSAGEAPVRLIIDPIDATRNFIRGIPVFATLLAIEEDGVIITGVVSAPALSTRWSAARGSGAYRGSRPLRVSEIRDLASAQLFHGSVAGVETDSEGPDLLALARRTKRQRGFGDFYQHVLTAEGAGEIAVDPVVSPWDIAPLQVLIEEAGGTTTSLAGEHTIYAGSFISSNGQLHSEALEILNGADPS